MKAVVIFLGAVLLAGALGAGSYLWGEATGHSAAVAECNAASLKADLQDQAVRLADMRTQMRRASATVGALNRELAANAAVLRDAKSRAARLPAASLCPLDAAATAALNRLRGPK